MNFNFLSVFVFLLALTGCYNGDKTLIPKQEFTPQEVEEGYNLKVEPKVDILFLIDDSGSMSSAQDDLADNIDLFTQQMSKNQFLDYQIGVITTSIGQSYSTKSGKLQGQPSIINKNTPDGLLKLAKNIKSIGVGGDSYEKFFDPLYASIDPVLNLNPSFVRSDAFFVLIFITDTKDQSESVSGFKVYNTFVNRKAYDFDQVLGYGVLSYPTFFGDTCTQDDRDPDNLLEFMSLFTNAYNTKIGGKKLPPKKSFPKNIQTLTNVFSLCDPDFGQKLANIGDDIRLRVSQKIPLPVRPIDGTIKLKYGTQVIDKKWWKYDFGTNSIILDPEVELDENQVDPQLFVSMDEADPLNTIGKPAKP